MDYDPPPEDEPGVCERLRLIEPVEKSKVEKRLHEWTFGNAEEDMSAWLDLFGTNSPGSLRVDVDAAVTTGEVFELVNQGGTRVVHAKVAAKAVARAADVAAVAAANAAIALIVGYVGASHISRGAQDAHADSLLEGAKSNNGGGLYKLRIQLTHSA